MFLGEGEQNQFKTGKSKFNLGFLLDVYGVFHFPKKYITYFPFFMVESDLDFIIELLRMDINCILLQNFFS